MYRTNLSRGKKRGRGHDKSNLNQKNASPFLYCFLLVWDATQVTLLEDCVHQSHVEQEKYILTIPFPTPTLSMPVNI